MTGLSSYAGALRVDEDAARFVVMSTWDSFADLARRTHGALDEPATPLLDFMRVDGAEHYELVGEPFVVHVATPDAIVRVARMTVEPGREEEFYEIVRRGLVELHPSGNLLAYHLGRRVERVHVAAAVSVWRSAEALEAVAPDADQPLWAADLVPLLSQFDVEHFDAVLVRGT